MHGHMTDWQNDWRAVMRVANIKTSATYRVTPDWAPHIVQFLLDVFAPRAPHKPNVAKVRATVDNVVANHVALMVLSGDTIISTIGLIPMHYWWCDQWLWGNVWFDTRDGYHAGDYLLRTVKRIVAPIEVHIQSEPRRTLSILNNPGW